MTATNDAGGHLVGVGDTSLYVVERGSGYPLIVLHGGPGLDHRVFGDYLDALSDSVRLVLVDQRAQGRSGLASPDTWTLEQMASDVSALASALGFDRYGVLGHSYGAFVALQHAVDHPGDAARTIVSSGLPSSRYLDQVDANLAAFEPAEMRDRVQSSWDREGSVTTRDEFAELFAEQMPFHFADPHDPRIKEFLEWASTVRYSPEVLRYFVARDYGGIEVEDRLSEVPQPVLVLAGRHDRTCPVDGAEAIARGLPNARLEIFEKSGHMTFVEENTRYVEVVRSFLLE